MSARGEGVAGVWIIMDLGIVSKIDTTMMLTNKFSAHHHGSWGEILGDTIFDGECIHPKDAKVYQIHNNQLVQSTE